MRIRVDFSALAETTWREYAVRFISGGLTTAAAGIVAEKFGPGVGGLFLAFPAILPAAATLIEKHEMEKKEARGLNGTVRARDLVSIDAAGSAMGAIGLLVFAALVWRFIPHHSSGLTLTGATLAWIAASVLVWLIGKRI